MERNAKKEQADRKEANRLQAEIDALLDDLGHHFDRIAEYHGIEYETINHIDIDAVLKMEIRISREPKRPAARAAPHSARKAIHVPDPDHAHGTGRHRMSHYHWLPKNPRKVVTAMPASLQRQMRDVDGADGSLPGKIARTILGRINLL